MITLITGVPGSGKTLYALNMVKARAEKESRTVFVNGVAECKLPWVPLDDPQKWDECPPGSIIVIDECQRVFRPRGTGAAVPSFVAALETHRHRGVDLVLITQHPMLIDTNVRRLVGQHMHVVRRFGMQKAVVHEWGAVSEVTPATIAEAVRHDFAYPAASFEWYKSAEVHTHKRRVPFRVIFLWLSPFILAGLSWYAYTRLQSFMSKPNPVSAPVVEATKGARLEGLRTAKADAAAAPGQRVPLSRSEYVTARTPRIPDLMHTAAVYDELTKPTRVPVPVSCIASVSRCQCYTQEGTPYAIRDNVCREVVRSGVFLDFEPDAKRARGSEAKPVEEVKTGPEKTSKVERVPEGQAGAAGRSSVDVAGSLSVKRDAPNGWADADRRPEVQAAK